jgi:hypothetical protein
MDIIVFQNSLDWCSGYTRLLRQLLYQLFWSIKNMIQHCWCCCFSRQIFWLASTWMVIHASCLFKQLTLTMVLWPIGSLLGYFLLNLRATDHCETRSPLRINTTFFFCINLSPLFMGGGDDITLVITQNPTYLVYTYPYRTRLLGHTIY